MALLPITLGLSSGSSDQKAGGKSAGSSAFEVPEDVRNRVLERDKYECQYCGFASRKYQIVRARDRKARPDDESGLVTSCIFCDQCFALDRVAAMKSGVLVWLPEIDQAMLHHVARAIYVARISQGPVADAARKLLEVLTGRREACRDRIRTDDPGILSLVLSDYIDARAYAERAKKLEGVRLFPLDRRIVAEGDLEFNQFPQILAYWRSKDGPFGNFQPAQWLEEFKSLKAA
jgi:intracellular multiplication protein IcmJ